jgi:acyl-CoA synthetase (AMP-forming)/AMP-acid ligase II
MKTEVILRTFAQRVPEREALVCEGMRVTYAEFDRRSNQLAAVLYERGVRVGDRVVLLVANGIAWPMLCVAVMKLGGLVVPVSTRLTSHEIAFIAGDSKPRAILASDDLRDVAERAADAAAVPVFTVGELDAAAAGASAAPLHVENDSDDCMIGYTSGTSGTPKGAITTHANLIFTGLLNNFDYGLNEHDRIMVTTPFAHRTAIARLYNTLTLGATLVITPQFDAAETLATFVRERISVTGLVPTVARMLLDAIEGDPAPYANLRMMISVGEAFPIELKKRLFATLPNIKLSSALAMTEAFGAAVLKSEDQITHAGAAGRPVPGVEVRLADDADYAVPTGEPGEIQMRAGGLGAMLMMRGYWNRPQETAEAFRDGWFRTGDMGRFDAEGYLYVVDRKKDMILSGGLNIYSKEVEQAILSHPSVADVAVVGTADPQFGEAVVAYIELKRDARATQVEIIEHCRALIASYKKPKYVFFDGFPKNAQGKALKKELRESAQDLATGTSGP